MMKFSLMTTPHNANGRDSSLIQTDPPDPIIWVRPLFAFACFVALSAPVFGVSSNSSDSDARITASAEDSYIFKTYLADDLVRIESKDGVVTLAGTVSDTSKVTLAEKTVENLPGVKSVNNALTLQTETPLELADDLIAMKVNFLLLVHPNVSTKTTNVAVHEGIVTLRGEASNLAQKELTAEYAADVAGVIKVENEMTVTEKMRESPETLGHKIDDASITAQIKTSLMWHRSTSAIHTEVVTKDGAVMINGMAKNEAEKTLVTKIAGDILGVSAVSNTMTVEGADVSSRQR